MAYSQNKLLPIITSIFLLFTVLFSTGGFPGSAFAADTNISEQKIEDTSLTDQGSIENIKNNVSYGPVDLDAYMAEAIRMAAPDSTATNKDISMEQDTRDARMLNSLLASNWMITRMVLFGIENVDSAADRLAKGEYITKTFDTVAPTVEETIMGVKASGAYQYSPQQTDRIPTAQEQKMLKLNEEMAATVKELSGMPGIKTGDTIYDRVTMIAVLLLACTFVLRLVGVMWRAFLGTLRQGEQPVQMLLECIAKLILFLAIIHFLKWGITALMMFAELVKNVIISATGTNGGTGELMSQLQALVSAKNRLTAGLEPDPGLLDKIFNAVNTVKTYIGWAVCYVFYAITSAIITVMVVLGDVMMAISAALGPLMVAIAMIKGFEGWLDNFIRNIVQYSLYMPLAAIYSVTMVMIFVLVPDIGIITYIAISWAFLLGAIYIPNLAEAMSGSALAALAVGFVGKIVSSAMIAGKMPLTHLAKKLQGK